MPASSPLRFDPAKLSDLDFRKFQSLIHDLAGIHLQASKKSLLCGRLAMRLRARGLDSFSDYYDLLASGNEAVELQHCVDRLTTNETSFFREPHHFDRLEQQILPSLRERGGARIWSAACSSGQEPYSLAMLCTEQLHAGRWEILASDISSRMLESAAAARYPIEQAGGIAAHRLRAHCLKGTRSCEGSFTLSAAIRERVRFAQINLSKPLPDIGRFDVVFLRNVLIYFDREMQRAVVERVLATLNPGGWMFIGHSESLNCIADNVVTVAPTVYRKN
jgi:chemotaxis protein methyltransferase CheR